MERPWNIVEQVVEDPSTKLRIEFSSVHTEEVGAGREAPLHDQIIYLRLWTSDRTRVATYAFTRGGRFIKTAVEHVDPGVHPQLEDGIEQAPINMRPPGTPPLVDINKPRADGPVQPVPGSDVFDDINYAKAFVGDI